MQRDLERMMNDPVVRKLERTISESNAMFENLNRSTRLAALWLLNNGYEDMLNDLWRAFYIRKPPTIQEFLTPQVMGPSVETLYPKWYDVMEEVFEPGSKVWEVILTGSIGSGKSTCARYSNLYKMVQVLCLRNPQLMMEKSPETILIMSLMTLTLDKAETALMKPYKNLLTLSPWFHEVKKVEEFNEVERTGLIPYIDKGSVTFPRQIMLTLGSQISHAVSYDTFAATLDEAELRPGDTVKALDLYTELRLRIKNRFLGSRFNFLTLVSSAKSSTGVISTYRKSFTEDDPTRKIYGFPIWEVKSRNAYQNGYFYVMRGTRRHPSMVLSPTDQERYEALLFEVPEGCEILKVPKDYYSEFVASIDKALRDVAGMGDVVDMKPFPATSHMIDTELPREIHFQAKLGDTLPLHLQLPDKLFIDTPTGKRLARYPNAWRYCFTGDTEVRLLSGESKSMERLTKDHEEGIQNWTYTWNQERGWTPGRVTSAHVSKSVTQLCRVTLDNGEVVRCTPDHKFMIRDGSYVEAQDLVAGQSLMPLYTDYDKYGYETVLDNRTKKFKCTHKISDHLIEIHESAGKELFDVRHHRDFNKYNNNPTNLIRMGKDSHIQLHADHSEGVGFAASWQRPEFREKMSEVNRENGRRNGAKNMTELWHGEGSDEWRKKRAPIQRESGVKNLTQYNQSDEHREKAREIMKKNRDPKAGAAAMRAMRVSCEYCGFTSHPQGVGTHKRTCSLNPNRVVLLCPNCDFTTYNAAGHARHIKSCLHNHKVVSVEVYECESTPVYDLTIDDGFGSHNFALKAGVVVSNCHLDLATVNEAGISLVHKELADDGVSTIYVADFVGWITSPTTIDYALVDELILDLALKFNVAFHTISADQFQSVQSRQLYEKRKIAQKVVYLSVDRYIQPYNSFSAAVSNNHVKVGPSPKLCRQLETLTVDNDKVFTTERKDISDSLCGSIENARSNVDDVPIYSYSHYNKRSELAAERREGRVSVL